MAPSPTYLTTHPSILLLTVCCSILKISDVAETCSVAGSPAVGTYQYVPVGKWVSGWAALFIQNTRTQATIYLPLPVSFLSHWSTRRGFACPRTGHRRRKRRGGRRGETAPPFMLLVLLLSLLLLLLLFSPALGTGP